MALCRARVERKPVGGVPLTGVRAPLQWGLESWVRREGWAGAKAKGPRFLLSSAAALNSKTARVPDSHLAFQGATEIRFSR